MAKNNCRGIIRHIRSIIVESLDEQLSGLKHGIQEEYYINGKIYVADIYID